MSERRCLPLKIVRLKRFILNNMGYYAMNIVLFVIEVCQVDCLLCALYRILHQYSANILAQLDNENMHH